jgi:hypothetical protein
MSTRERWIVYPLLFLTLGIAMRNQFLPTNVFKAMDLRANDIKVNEFTAHTILCDGLVVRDKASCSRIEYKSAVGEQMAINGFLKSLQFRSTEAEFGKLAITDEQGQPVVAMQQDQNTKAGVIQTMLANGAPQVQIYSNGSGGIVNTIGHSGQVLVAMGHDGENFGVFAQFPQTGRPQFPITTPSRFQSQPLLPKSTPNTQPEEKKDEPKKEEMKPEIKTIPPSEK